MKQRLLIFTMKSCLTLLVMSLGINTLAREPEINVRKIWDQAPHNAFTDLVRFKNAFYCTFREGSGHIPGTDGKIRILKSNDGLQWTSVALVEKNGYDLRDPKLSVTPKGKLMLLLRGAVYIDGKPIRDKARCYVSLYNNSVQDFYDLAEVKYDSDINTNAWLWRVIWHKKKAYGVAYFRQDSLTWRISLVSSADGINYSLVKTIDIDGLPNETALRFNPEGELILLVRREDPNQNKIGYIGKSSFPFQEWQWINTEFRIGGPNFLISPEGKLIIGTRTFSKNGSRTGLLSTDQGGKFRLLMEFPSGGDTSYPGMVIYKKKLFISYYSSHEDKTSIYFTQIPMEDINRLIEDNAASPFK